MARIGELIGPNGEVMHPKTSASMVCLEDGRSVEQVLSDDIDYGNVVFQDNSYKFSSDVEDDFAKTVIIKGQTYQNILPEPSTHVLTNNKEMFKVNEGLDPNVEIVDGVSKSAILSGQTLVNASGETITNLIINTSTPKYLRQHILKQGVVYTFVFDVEEVTDGASGVWGRFNYTDGSFKSILDKAYTTGITKVATSFDKELNNIYIGWIRNHATGQSVKFKSVMILEGDWTNKETPPYFDGMQSVNFYPNQTVTKLVWKTGQYYGDDGQLTTVKAQPTHRYIDEYIEISPNMVYRASGNNNYKNLNFYDKNKTHLLKVTSTTYLGDGALTGDIAVTAPNNAKYLRYNMAVGKDLTEGTVIYNDTIGIPLASTNIANTYTHKIPVLKTIGKNLNDGTGDYIGLSGGDGACDVGVFTGDGTLKRYSHIVKCKPKTTYTLTTGGTANRCGLGEFAEYPRSGVIGTKWGNTGESGTITITTKSDTQYLVCYSYYRETAHSQSEMNEIIQGLVVQLEESSTATPYEQYKTNTLHTPKEVVLRSLPNGVKDTLNLNTGEYVKRIGEIVLDGSSDEQWSLSGLNSDGTKAGFYILSSNITPQPKVGSVTVNNKLPLLPEGAWGSKSHEGCDIGSNALAIVVNTSKLSTPDVGGIRTYLQSNPITVQYELATPVIKTVDLSTSGNWEKVVLDGSDDESWGDGDNSLSKTHRFYVRIHNLQSGNHRPITDSTYFTPIQSGTSSQDSPCVQVASNNIYFRIERQIADDLTSFKAWLQQNPLTVWYPTATYQDSTQVKQPIFFKDGHIIQSSGADHSLIPTLDYQAKTSNSYVMDLMKTNTRYTMKAKSASGTFTIDGTSYGAGTNGTFTTPSSMTNKLLVMSNKTNEEVMIIEGDVVSKIIPYFKGIKSAFEDESQIEVLSTGKNLVNKEEFKEYLVKYGTSDTSFYKEDGVDYGVINNSSYNLKPFLQGAFKPNTQYTFSARAKIHTESKGFYVCFCYNDGSVARKRTDSTDFTTIVVTSGAGKTVDYAYLSYGTGGHRVTIDLDSVQITETSNFVEYEPYKSNSTKIPLLSSLRSLPNGVCDEVIIDRMKKKATLIQRVGYVKYDNMDDISFGDDNGSPYLYLNDRPKDMPNRKPSASCSTITSHFAYYTDGQIKNTSRGNYTAASNIVLCWCLPELPDKRARMSFLRSLAKLDGVEVQYELEFPTVTELDLNGFPAIYKEGHLFLNGEITPTVGIEYGINQGHRIEGQVESLQRHEKQFTQLERYFADLVHSDYNFALLRFSEKLHQQEGDV